MYGVKRPTHAEQGQTGPMKFLPEVRVDLLAESCLKQKEGYGRHAPTFLVFVVSFQVF